MPGFDRVTPVLADDRAHNCSKLYGGNESAKPGGYDFGTWFRVQRDCPHIGTPNVIDDAVDVAKTVGLDVDPDDGSSTTRA